MRDEIYKKIRRDGGMPSAIGPIGDIFEQEADRVADAVMRMPELGSLCLAKSILQVKQSPGQCLEVASGFEACLFLNRSTPSSSLFFATTSARCASIQLREQRNWRGH